MNRSFDLLRDKVLQAVEGQRQNPTSPGHRHMRVLAEFLHLQLAKLTLSEMQLAQHINLGQEQVDRLLQGTLRKEDFTEEVLQQLGHVLNCDINVMRIILYGPDSPQIAAP